MFRQVATRLLTRSTTTTTGAAATIRRPYATDVSTTASAGDNDFIEAWKKVSPNIDPPKTPIQFMESRPPTPSNLPSKLTVNFVLPYAAELSKQEMVTKLKNNPPAYAKKAKRDPIYEKFISKKWRCLPEYKKIIEIT